MTMQNNPPPGGQLIHSPHTPAGRLCHSTPRQETTFHLAPEPLDYLAPHTLVGMQSAPLLPSGLFLPLSGPSIWPAFLCHSSPWGAHAHALLDNLLFLPCVLQSNPFLSGFSPSKCLSLMRHSQLGSGDSHVKEP